MGHMMKEPYLNVCDEVILVYDQPVKLVLQSRCSLDYGSEIKYDEISRIRTVVHFYVKPYLQLEFAVVCICHWIHSVVERSMTQ